jgi:pimeloyl-ACP methyl ester carboxylesterase
MARMHIHTVTVRGVRSLVRESGREGAREAVVFVHGNPGSSEDYTALVAALGDHVRTVAPDMPGYGKADRPRDFAYTVEGYAEHLQGVMVELGVERVHLVLHDMGGLWGLCWAAAHPNQVASLVLMNIGVLRGYRYHKYGRLWRMPLLGELSYAVTTRRLFKALLNGDNPRPLPDSLLDRMWDDSDRGNHRAVLALYRATPEPAKLTESFGRVLGPLAIPALVIWGAEDEYLPVSYAERQKDHFDAEVHTLPGVGHWPMVEAPERVSELLTDFVQRQLARASSG